MPTQYSFLLPALTAVILPAALVGQAAVVALLFSSSAIAEGAFEHSLDELLGSSVVVYRAPNPTLPCHPEDDDRSNDDGCGGFGSGTVYGMADEGSAGIILTNAHVVRDRESVAIFIPKLSQLKKYDYEFITKFIKSFLRPQRPIQWSGGGAAGVPCSVNQVRLPSDRGPLAEDLGMIVIGRVIARHPRSDLAIIQACSLGTRPLTTFKYCRGLREGDVLYSVGTSRTYGHVTPLVASFVACDDDLLRYKMPREVGRSGSPLVSEDGHLVGIHASGVRMEGRGVPIEKAHDLLASMELVKAIHIRNNTRIPIEFWYRCQESASDQSLKIEPTAGVFIRCSYGLRGHNSIPARMVVEFDSLPSTMANPEENLKSCSVYPRIRYAIEAEHGGAPLNWKLDAEKFQFNYARDDASRIRFLRLASSGGSMLRPLRCVSFGVRF
ncbi:MAG: trypsin-like peptidase domain-containing protein [Proteobacteria bacterium]|nr:trypsin-like peptidase domain-containing protein [Pseudomonadota bacterium]